MSGGYLRKLLPLEVKKKTIFLVTFSLTRAQRGSVA
jgi:hypothetical protein